MTGVPIRRIALVGFGEVGGVFGGDFAVSGIDVSAYDLLMCGRETSEAMLAKARDRNVRACESIEEAIAGADLVISAVTASSAIEAGRKASAHLRQGQIYLDINSVSPETKGAIAEAIVPSGADFVEAAVMAPVAPQRLKVPMLLGGARAEDLAKSLNSLGMDATAVAERVGVASAIKMCRSVMMKGLAALAIEALFAARRYGAEDAVLASFNATYPQMGWNGNLPDTLIRRAAVHSRRRASEMREVVRTLKHAGLNPVMASSTAALQDWLTGEMEAHHLAYDSNEPFSWRSLADAIADGPKSDQKTL